MNQLPKLHITGTSNPRTGEYFVLDENNHCVANFRVKRPECHVANPAPDNFDAGLNLDLAKDLILALNQYWTPVPKFFTINEK